MKNAVKTYKDIDKTILKAIPNPTGGAYEIKIKVPELTFLGVQEQPDPKHTSVKEVVFPFSKFPGVDCLLGPEMRSTGEVMGIDATFGQAFYKAELAGSNLGDQPVSRFPARSGRLRSRSLRHTCVLRSAVRVAVTTRRGINTSCS